MNKAAGLRARMNAVGPIVFMAALVAPLSAAAQQPTSAQASAIRQACRADYQANCAGVPTGGQAALACLQRNAAKTSPACQQALSAAGGEAQAATATAA